MSLTGAEKLTNPGRLTGVHRAFRFNPRGTLNSSKRLFVKFNYGQLRGCARNLVSQCVVCREADSIWNP
jgi:hypothetical protein